MNTWSIVWDGTDAAKASIQEHFGVTCSVDKFGNITIPGVFDVGVWDTINHADDGRRWSVPAATGGGK